PSVNVIIHPEDALITVPEDEAIKAIRQQHWIQDSTFLSLNVDNPAMLMALFNANNPQLIPIHQTMTKGAVKNGEADQSYVLDPDERLKLRMLNTNKKNTINCDVVAMKYYLMLLLKFEGINHLYSIPQQQNRQQLFSVQND
ncbi:34707_t:CDS:2, partial [Racocetra persica]